MGVANAYGHGLFYIQQKEMGSTIFYFYCYRIPACFTSMVFSAAANESRIDPDTDLIDLQKYPVGYDSGELFIKLKFQ